MRAGDVTDVKKRQAWQRPEPQRSGQVVREALVGRDVGTAQILFMVIELDIEHLEGLSPCVAKRHEPRGTAPRKMADAQLSQAREPRRPRKWSQE